MTRRLNPIDRVKELSDASVPFPFDVHAMIYSKNAPTLEAALHREFNGRRMNKVNHRKEFFEVALDEIVAAVHANQDEDTVEISFTMVAEAEEYRRTLALIAESEERESSSPTDQIRASLEARMESW